MWTRPVAVVLAAVLECGVALAAKPPQESPQEILRKAADRTLGSKRAGPVTLRYTLRFADGRTGTFEWRRRDRESIREDIRVGPLNVSRGVMAGKGWRSQGDEALETWWLVSSVLDMSSRLTFEDGDQLRTGTKKQGAERFIEVWAEGRRKRPKEAVLFTIPDLNLVVAESAYERFQYAGWKNLTGVGVVPGACSHSIQGEPALEMTLEMGTNKPIGDAELAPPPNAVDWAYCADEGETKPVSQPSPVYPEGTRLDRVQGFVVLAAVIQTDGSVSGVRVVRAPSGTAKSLTMLVDAAIAAVSQWRYEPPLCKGVPTPEERQFTFVFQLD